MRQSPLSGLEKSSSLTGEPDPLLPSTHSTYAQLKAAGGVWDRRSKRVAGNVNKRKHGLFSRGGWDSRYFIIEHEIDVRHNYKILYYYRKSDYQDDVRSEYRPV